MLEDLQITRVDAEPVSDRAEQVMVPMRDGVELATDVYLPATTPAAAVLVRLPYDKNSRYVFFERVARRFTDRGFAMVVQDVRGKFRSGGATEPFEHEVADGYDTIEWLTAQPWCDGAVGMFGDSYYGFTQWAAVASGHPALKAIVPRVTSADLGRETLALGGGRGAAVPWLEGATYFATHWVARESYDYVPDWTARPVLEAYERAFAAIGLRSSAFDARIPEMRAADPFPEGHHPFDARPLPVLHCVGWFDNLAANQMRDYAALASRPEWAAHQYLSAGSHDHENYPLELAPIAPADDHDSDDAALERMLDAYAGPALDFLDVFLRGEGDPETLPRVSWELAHAGPQISPEWPPPGAAPRELHLRSGVLAEEPGGDPVSWLYDPRDLVPSTVANSFAFLFEYPDEHALGERGDVLVVTGEPVTEPLDLAGPISLSATLETGAPTADVFVRLLDLAPDGGARLIVRGQVRAPSGAIDVDLGHTGYRLRPGHALRLHVCSSDYPLFLPNSGTEENPWTATDPRPSTQTLSAARLRLTVL
jgi:uncharacterized protein